MTDMTCRGERRLRGNGRSPSNPFLDCDDPVYLRCHDQANAQCFTKGLDGPFSFKTMLCWRCIEEYVREEGPLLIKDMLR